MRLPVLILTGACGVGKSTIAQAWALHHGAASIECDYFTEWLTSYPYERFSSFEERFVAELALSTSEAYLTHQIPIVLEYVWNPVGLSVLLEGLSKLVSEEDIRCVLIQCALEENQKRDRERMPENRMGARVALVKSQLAACIWPQYVMNIDSTGQSAGETLQIIQELF